MKYNMRSLNEITVDGGIQLQKQKQKIGKMEKQGTVKKLPPAGCEKRECVL